MRAHRPDLVLLDLMLDGADGFDLCRDIRAESSVGIIVVSARRGEHDKVRALNLGADDYLTKPFGIDELLARITALLRRSRVTTSPLTAAEPLRFGAVTVDLDAQLVTKDGEVVHLTPTEFALLRELAQQPGKLLTSRRPPASSVGPRVRDGDRVHPGVRAAPPREARGARRSATHRDRAPRRLPHGGRRLTDVRNLVDVGPPSRFVHGLTETSMPCS